MTICALLPSRVETEPCTLERSINPKLSRVHETMSTFTSRADIG